MAKPIILFAPPESAGELDALQKSHVSSYTRKDGTYVAEHDDKRPAVATAFSARTKSATTSHTSHPAGSTKPAASWGQGVAR